MSYRREWGMSYLLVQSADALTRNAQASTAPGRSHLLQELRHRLLEQRR
jgi:hypothetical protein